MNVQTYTGQGTWSLEIAVFGECDVKQQDWISKTTTSICCVKSKGLNLAVSY